MKEHIPDLETLQRKLSLVLESNLPDFIESTHSRREEVIGYRRWVLIATFFCLATILGLYIISPLFESAVVRFATACIILWIVILFVTGSKWLTNSRLLAQEMNMALVPILSHVFDRTLLYTETEEHRDETIHLLRESSLLTTPDIEIEADDRYTVFGEREISIRELQVVKLFQNKHGEKSKANLFTGVFVLAQLPFTVEGKTYVSTEGDRTGFAHKTFWNDLLGRSDVKETQLESNDFERDLHIATTNPAAAREILNPAFMEDLHEWWKEHQLNIRIAFIGNIMYMLLPDAAIKFSESTISTKIEDIEQYAWTVIQPIWRSLKLIEDVEQR